MPSNNTQPAAKRWTLAERESLLAAHMVCAGELLHVQAEGALRKDLALGEPAKLALEKILNLDANRIPLAELLPSIPVDARALVYASLLRLAAIDGYLDRDEEALLALVAKEWAIPQDVLRRKRAEIDSAIRKAVAQSRGRLSLTAKVVGLFARVTGRRAERQSGNGNGAVEAAWLEYLLGSAYHDAIEQCVRQAAEDYPFTQETLTASWNALLSLEHALNRIMKPLQEEAAREDAEAAKRMHADATKTQNDLRIHMTRHAQELQESFRKKTRSVDRVTIAFLGRTKAGKSTLHTILTNGDGTSIGRGAQRTTLVNRTYEWERLRIIDTPGFGATVGANAAVRDAATARSVLPESDLVCFVVTDDSQQPTDFEVLGAIRQLAKPLIVILNVKKDLTDEDVLQDVLVDPERLLPRKAVLQHEQRIRKRAAEAYGSDNFELVPVHLFAAYLAQQPNASPEVKKLWAHSGIQELLDRMRIAIIEEGPIRRTQTLLGMLEGELAQSRAWARKAADTYAETAKLLRRQCAAGLKRLAAAVREAQAELSAGISQQMLRISHAVPAFAEVHWNSSESLLNFAWKQKLEQLAPEKEVQKLVRGIEHRFGEKVEEIVKDTAVELKLSQSLAGLQIHLVAQDSGILTRTVMQVVSIVLRVVGAVATFLSTTPLGPFLWIGAQVLQWISNLFTTESERRARSAGKIQAHLQTQLDDYERKLAAALREELQTSAHGMVSRYAEYFERIAKTADEIEIELRRTASELERAGHNATRLYAKRVLDAATDTREPLSHQSTDRAIGTVHRNFGVSLQILTRKRKTLKVPVEKLSRTVQETIAFGIEPKKRRR